MILFRNILVAADFSEGSQEGFRVACSLAREDKTRLYVLNVLEPNYVPETPVYVGEQSIRYTRVARPPAVHEAMKERLKEIYVPSQPLDVQYTTREGDAAHEILAAASEHGSDLIVMGTHGRTGLRRLLTGSIAEQVLRRAHCPVMALRSHVKPHSREPIQTILHPTDFSENSEPALQVARLLAQDHGARLILLHVTPPMIAVDGMAGMEIDPQIDLESLDLIRKRVDGPDLKYPVEIRRDYGGAAFSIVRLAEEVGAGLIVMGSHGRTGLGRLLLGSEAEVVLRRADCPVLIIKPSTISPSKATTASAEATPKSDQVVGA